MVSSKITTFRKSEDCPTSNELLEYQRGFLAERRDNEVGRHLARCEFCAAEIDLYSRYPQDDASEEGIESSRIPAALFQLAEALLKKKDNDPSSLDALARENGILLDKA